MTTHSSKDPSFPGLTGESRKALDARLKHAGMTNKKELKKGNPNTIKLPIGYFRRESMLGMKVRVKTSSLKSFFWILAKIMTDL
jgi:hypothetical protein